MRQDLAGWPEIHSSFPASASLVLKVKAQATAPRLLLPLLYPLPLHVGKSEHPEEIHLATSRNADSSGSLCGSLHPSCQCPKPSVLSGALALSGHLHFVRLPFALCLVLQ